MRDIQKTKEHPIAELVQMRKRIAELEAVEAEHKRPQYNLAERVKELNCLYSISQIVERRGSDLNQLCQEVVNTLPQGWKYPEIAWSRITINDDVFQTANYRDTKWRQSADIKVRGAKAGMVEVGYLEEQPAVDGEPFSTEEERLLLNAVAERLGRIIERTQAQEELRESEVHYRFLFETMAQGVVYQDSDGNIISCNPAAEHILGLTFDQMTGRASSDPGWKAIREDGTEFPGETYPAMVALRTGKPVTNVVMGVFNPIGEEYRWIRINAIPRFKAGEDKPYQVYTIFDDNTERRRAVESLRSSEERYNLAIHSTGEGIWDWNMETNEEYYSPRWCEILGYSYDDPELAHDYNSWASRIHPDDHKRVVDALKAHLENGAVYDVDYRHRYKSGEYRWQNSRGQAIFNGNGKPIRMVGCIRDITERKKAEEALRASEENFRNSLDSSPVGISIVTADGKNKKNLYANRALLDMYGYSSIEELDVIPAKERYAPESYSARLEREKRIERGESAPSSWERSIVRKNGEVRHLAVSRGEVLWNGERHFLRVHQDITERKRAEEALRASEENFRNSLDNSPLGIRIFNADGETIYANRAFLDMYGYSTIEEFAAVPAEKRHTAESYSTHLERLSRRKSGRHVLPNREVSIVRKDGKVRQLAVSRGEVLWNGQRQTQTVSQDITERKKAEEALELSEGKLRLIFESATSGILVLDPKGKITQLNGAVVRMLGYGSVEELVGQNALDLIAKRNHAQAVESMKSAEGRQVSGDIEYAFLTRDGREFPTSVSTGIMRSRSGSLAGLVIIFEDISERKQAELKLEEKNKELEQANIHLKDLDQLKSIFLASMSHELRTPMNSIIGFTSLILMDKVGGISEEQRKQLTLVKSSANHLMSLINDVLDISKVEAGKAELSIEEFSLDALMKEVVETHSPIAGLKDIEVITEIPTGITLLSDRRRLKQVVMNLLSNAVKFTEQGSVKITAGVPGNGNLEISVTDTGVGMKKEDVDKLFAPFQQVGMSLTKKHGGTGLGLYLSKKLVNLLGGDISVKSEYGRGSEFAFTIPLQYVKE